MFGLGKNQKRERDLLEKCFNIGVGMLRVGKTLAQVQEFLEQYCIADRYKRSVAKIVIAVMTALEQRIKGGNLHLKLERTYIEATPETHVSVKSLTAEEYQAELKKRAEKKPELSQA